MPGELNSPKLVSIPGIDRKQSIASLAFPVENENIAASRDRFERALA